MRRGRSVVRVSQIEQRILLIRGEKVIIDADLAEFYGVATKRLNEQVKRNEGRFPEDFLFQLNMVISIHYYRALIGSGFQLLQIHLLYLVSGIGISMMSFILLITGKIFVRREICRFLDLPRQE